MKSKTWNFFVMAVGAILWLTSGIGNMYVQRQGENGWVFHIFSQKMEGNEIIAGASKTIKYDFTYIQASDSVVMLTTIVLPIGAKPISESVETCGSVEKFTPDIVYVKPKNRGAMEYRLKVSFPFEFWDNMYKCPNAYKIYYDLEGRDTERLCSYGYSASAWKSKREKILGIIEVVKYNTRKI